MFLALIYHKICYIINLLLFLKSIDGKPDVINE